MDEGRFHERLRTLTDEPLETDTRSLEGHGAWNPERRAQRRRPVEVLHSESGLFISQRGLLQENSSPIVASILVGRPVQVGSRIKVRRYGEESVGTVLRCRHESFGYVIGIEYDHKRLSGV